MGNNVRYNDKRNPVFYVGLVRREHKTMTLDELGTKLELMDDEEIIYCFVDNDKLIRS